MLIWRQMLNGMQCWGIQSHIILLSNGRSLCTGRKCIETSSQGLSRTWHHFLAMLDSQEILPVTKNRDPKLRRLDLLLAFSRRRADLLFALNPADVTSLVKDGAPPRDYYDQRLIIAIRRLRSTFSGQEGSLLHVPGEGLNGPTINVGGSLASLQDLMRVIQGWTSLDPSQVTPGTSGCVERLLIQLIEASRNDPVPEHTVRSQLCATPNLEKLVTIGSKSKTNKPGLRSQDIRRDLRFQTRLLDATSRGIIEKGDWECSVCLTLNERSERACRRCDLAVGALGNRRVSPEDVSMLYPGPEPPTRQLMPRQMSTNPFGAELGDEALKLRTSSPDQEAVEHSRRFTRTIASISPGQDLIDRGLFQDRTLGEALLRRGSTQPLLSDVQTVADPTSLDPDGAKTTSGSLSKDRREEEDYSIRRIRSAVALVSQGEKISRKPIHQSSGQRKQQIDWNEGGIDASFSHVAMDGDDAEEFDGPIGATDVTQPEARGYYEEFYTNPPIPVLGVSKQRRKLPVKNRLRP